MKAQKLRTVIIQQANIADIWTAMNLLQNGNGLTALQSGVAVETPIANVELVGDPKVWFDGFFWNVFLFVTTG